MTPAELHAIAHDPACDPLTRRAAQEARVALDAARERHVNVARRAGGAL